MKDAIHIRICMSRLDTFCRPTCECVTVCCIPTCECVTVCCNPACACFSACVRMRNLIIDASIYSSQSFLWSYQPAVEGNDVPMSVPFAGICEHLYCVYKTQHIHKCALHTYSSPHTLTHSKIHTQDKTDEKSRYQTSHIMVSDMNVI